MTIYKSNGGKTNETSFYTEFLADSDCKRWKQNFF